MRNKPFVSAQRRYDNARVREHEIRQRLCEECGKVISGGDSVFQHHVVSHEAAFICYQLYHFEKGSIIPKQYYGHQEAKLQKPTEDEKAHHSESSATPEKRTFRKTIMSQQVKEKQPPAKKPKLAITPKAETKAPPEPAFIQEDIVELQLSSESDSTNTTDDEEEIPADLLLLSGSESEVSGVDEEDVQEDYKMLAQGTSSRGRQRKPKPIN
ncbi:unnamed protein product [Bursaphelenchus okinawaensis]|uniref:C2H2-type domain-containing protein n=1 Tax=Bursaphelenchus okinawaensis TaxID=465554 RepID=A0A811KXH5_9BILA|nr:unnamed protein product [Bursaphelenchus okinawaensis]CAG9112677.1 unnamed protein product [Bursaphelenchus okinawaensis]